MKKTLLVAAVLVGSSFLFARPAFAEAGQCNSRCQVNEDCGEGYRCYVGVCRSAQCPSSSTCGCTNASPTPTPTPTVTPRGTSTPTPTPTPTATPVASSTPKATTSGDLKRTPSTGPETDIPLLLSFSLFSGGMGLYIKDYLSKR